MAKGLHLLFGGNSRLQPSAQHIDAHVVKAGPRNARCAPILLLALSLSPHFAQASDSATAPAHPGSPAIVVGFVGGFVHADDQRHSEVQLVNKLRIRHAAGLYSQVFDNRHRKDAHRAILQWLDTDGDGNLSEAEKAASRIILFGHSWGGAAVISLARELQQENISVLLTIQVDSITKIGQNDRMVPANVAKAVNFYQTHGFLHGRSKIAPADPLRTQILGEFRLNYDELPAECNNYPWADRHLFKGHTAIECDPQVWSRIETLIESSLAEDAQRLADKAPLH